MPGLRVAVDVTPLLGVRAGVTQCVEHLLAALPGVAPDITVVPYVLSGRARRRADELPAGTRFLPVPAGLAIRAWSLADHPGAGRAFADIDVVHGTNFVVPPSKRPSTLTVHDTWCLRYPRACASAVRPFRRAAGRAIERGAWVHVSTVALEQQVRDLYGATRVEVVPFGVPPVAAAGALPDGVAAPYALSISTLEPRKRIDHLVRAFASVAASHADLRLVVAGADGGATGAVTAAIGALPDGIRQRVVRLGAVDDATRATLIRRAAVVAYPSADEGFGYPVLEAMSVGVPVVTTGEGSLREVAGDAALLIPVDDDPAPLADALRLVVTDDELRATLCRRGTRRAADFSWEAHATGMAALWRKAAT